MQDETIVDVNPTPATSDVATNPVDTVTPTSVSIGFPNGEEALEALRNVSIFVEAAGTSIENIERKITARQFLGAIYTTIEQGIQEAKARALEAAKTPEVSTETDQFTQAHTETQAPEVSNETAPTITE